MREAAMGLSAATGLFLIFLVCEVVQSYSGWSVTYFSKSICGIKGSTVEMRCLYSYPHKEDNTIIRVNKTFWFIKIDKDPIDVQTQEEYAGRVQHSCEKKYCTLTIKDLKESDSAVYKFRFITNKPGGSYTGEQGVQLSVTDLKVSVQTKSNAVRLRCSSSCVLPRPSKYVWYKNGQTLHTDMSIYNGQVDNMDSMSCAVKGFEDFPSPSVCVWSQYCKKVTYSQGRICAFKGSSVTIRSYYSADSVAAFWFTPGRSKEWRYFSQPEDLKQDSQYAGRVQVTNTRRQSTLTINNLTEIDSAEYRFIFQTDRFNWERYLHGTTLTVTALQVQVRRASANQDPRYVELKCHSSCTLAGYHYNHYIWFRNGQDVHHRASTYEVWINPTDKISCAISQYKERRAPEVYAPVSLSVQGVLSDDIVEGDPMFLNCSSDANPSANYTWYKKTKTSALQLLREHSQFSLSTIQFSDSGEYFCVAKNQLGESRSMYFNVDVKYAPKRADVSLSHKEVVEGNSVNLICSSDGNPAPSYSWYKDNQVMLRGQAGVYQFSSVRSGDSGMYHCEARNVYGQINSSSVFINVEYSPRLTSVSMNPPGEIAAGSSVILTCSSVANPAATYTWYKERSTSPAGHGQTLTIVDIGNELDRNYYCQARNSRGHHNSTLHLIVISSSASSAVAGSITFILLVGLFLCAFIMFRKKMAVRQIHETRERPGDNGTNNLGNSGRQLETPSTAALGNSADQDNVYYASVHFSKQQDEPLYSNFVPAEPKTPQNEEEGEDVEYSMVMIKNTPCKRSYDASEESSALYSTVCKVNRL